MKVETREIRKKSTLLDMNPGSVFLYPSAVESVPDYVMLRVFSHCITSGDKNIHIIAVRLEDGWMMGVTDETLKEDTEYTIIPDAKVKY